MARLAELLEGVAGAHVVRGDPALEIVEVRDDSRRVCKGDLFVASPGTQQDGREFIDDALARGAAAVLTESEGIASTDSAQKVALIAVPHVRRARGVVAAQRLR